MKNMRKTTIREIKQTFGRFMAILSIIALGVGFFSGVKVTTPAMVNMMGNFINENNLYDFRLISTIGWDKESVNNLTDKENVKYVEGGYGVDAIFVDESDDELVVKIHNIPENVNNISLKKGRMPEKTDECIVTTDGYYKLGEKLVLSEKNKEDTYDSLKVKEFTIVGMADTSLYIDYSIGNTSVGSGSFTGGYMYVMPEIFDIDYFTDIYVRFDDEHQIYSEEYKDFIESKKDSWENIAQEQADKRYDRIISEAQEEIDDAKKELEEERTKNQKDLDDAEKELSDAKTELDDAEKKLADAEKEIADGEKELVDAKKELDDGKKELADAKKELDDAKITLDESEQKLLDGEKQLADGEEQLAAARAELEKGLAEYNAQEAFFYAQYGEAVSMIDFLPPEQQELIRGGLAQLEAAKSQLDSGMAEIEYQQGVIDSSRAELEEGRAAFESGKKEYEKGLAEYEKGKKDLEKGEKEYNDGVKKLEDAKKEYENGLKEYNDGLEEYNDGFKEYTDGKEEFNDKISDAEKEIADAESEIADVEKPDIYLLDREMNSGYATFKNDSEIVEQVAKVFPIFFILVAALVCMTTMSRMVEEQRTQIGMFKALGYSEMSIMGKFMFYSGSAALIGCIAGFFAGTYAFPVIIWITYSLMYVPLEMPYMFDLPLFIASLIASMVCSLGMTWFSCRVALLETAANLMRPKAPKAGKRVLPERIPFLWNRLKFLHKVSIRNIFRYKGRLFMMIIGIGGCTALLLTGFGLKDSVARFADVQYDEIQICDSRIYYNDDEYEEAEKVISEKAENYIMFREYSWDLICGNSAKSIYLEVIDDFENISDFVVFRTTDGEKIEYPKTNEALICHSIADRNNIKIGDEIIIRDPDMNEMHVKVSGIFENHVYNFIYISKETYKEQFGEDIKFNSAYMNFRNDNTRKDDIAQMYENSCIKTVAVFQDMKENIANTMSSLNYVVILVIICAAGLAFIVIYNLTNINITERTREIATIKVLGFFRNETSAYVLRENLALTAIGTAVGIVLGILLHRFVMAQIVIDVIEFSVRILPLSYVLSIVLTFVFNFIVNIFMEIKLEKINMAESLKSVD